MVLAVMIVAIVATPVLAQRDPVEGKWTNGSVGLISYQNRATGATRPGRGRYFAYDFKADGSYEFIGYMEVTIYNCTTTLFNEIKGKYKVSGSSIELSPSRDFWKNTNSCAASGNKERTQAPTKKELSYEIRQDEQGRGLLCIAEAEGETCYRKDEQ